MKYLIDLDKSGYLLVTIIAVTSQWTTRRGIASLLSSTPVTSLLRGLSAAQSKLEPSPSSSDWIDMIDIVIVGYRLWMILSFLHLFLCTSRSVQYHQYPGFSDQNNWDSYMFINVHPSKVCFFIGLAPSPRYQHGSASVPRVHWQLPATDPRCLEVF